MNPLFRTTLTVTIESRWPCERDAIGGAADLIREVRDVLHEDERLVKTAMMVRQVRTDGEIDDS